MMPSWDEEKGLLIAVEKFFEDNLGGFEGF
jgi:hypothetical protein